MRQEWEETPEGEIAIAIDKFNIRFRARYALSTYGPVLPNARDYASGLALEVQLLVEETKQTTAMRWGTHAEVKAIGKTIDELKAKIVKRDAK